MTDRRSRTRVRRPHAILSALVCVPVGLATKRAPLAAVADHGGGSIYVMFWSFVVFALVPRAPRGVTVVAVVVATFGIEFLQLVDGGWLDAARSHRLGRLLLGTVFSWGDFPAYAVGGLGAWWLAGRVSDQSPQ